MHDLYCIERALTTFLLAGCADDGVGTILRVVRPRRRRGQATCGGSQPVVGGVAVHTHDPHGRSRRPGDRPARGDRPYGDRVLGGPAGLLNPYGKSFLLPYLNAARITEEIAAVDVVDRYTLRLYGADGCVQCVRRFARYDNHRGDRQLGHNGHCDTGSASQDLLNLWQFEAGSFQGALDIMCQTRYHLAILPIVYWPSPRSNRVVNRITFLDDAPTKHSYSHGLVSPDVIADCRFSAVFGHSNATLLTMYGSACVLDNSHAHP